VDIDEKLAMGFIYEEMHNAKEKIQLNRRYRVVPSMC